MLHNIVIKLPHINLAALSTVSEIDAKKPIVVFLHGYLDNANSFEDLLLQLGEYQCIALDMAGHGLSDHRSADAHYHLVDYAYDLAQVIKYLHSDQVFLVGHSLGGIVCSIYAASKPSVLRGFVAIESCGPLSEIESTTAEQIRDCFASREKANNPIKQPTSLELLVKARCAISDLNSQEARLILMRNIALTGNQDETSKDIETLVWRTDKRLRTKSSFRFTEAQALNVLENISCKRIVILGTQGFSKVKSAIENRKSGFEGVRILMFAGGHHVHMSAYIDIGICIDRFLKDSLVK